MMASGSENTEVTNKRTKDRIYIQYVSLSGSGLISLAMYIPDNHDYLFRKMSQAEMDCTLDQQKLQYDLKQPITGEKWLAEDMSHSRGFKSNDPATVRDPTAEFKVKSPGYSQIRKEAIPQKHSKVINAEASKCSSGMKNLTNTERLSGTPGKINIGLKGAKNVDTLNKYVLKVSGVDPHSFTNKSKWLTWARRNPGGAALATIGIALDGYVLIISLIDDKGSFGKSTQISVGEILGGMAGGSAATALGAQIGAALGVVLPGVGSVVLSVLGGVIGSLIGGKVVKGARYMYMLHLEKPSE